MSDEVADAAYDGPTSAEVLERVMARITAVEAAADAVLAEESFDWSGLFDLHGEAPDDAEPEPPPAGPGDEEAEEPATPPPSRDEVLRELGVEAAQKHQAAFDQMVDGNPALRALWAAASTSSNKGLQAQVAHIAGMLNRTLDYAVPQAATLNRELLAEAAQAREEAETARAEKMQREAAAGFAWTDLDGLWDSPAPAPSVLVRTDGAALFYLGQRNLLAGKTGGGKSLLMMHAVMQEVRAGRPVVIFDWENGGEMSIGRLRAMGLRRSELALIRYVSMDGPPLPVEAAADLAGGLAGAGGRLAVFDALTPVSRFLGLPVHEGNTHAVESLYALTLDPWTAAGCAAVMLDNSPKGNPFDAAGNQHKIAGVKGTAAVLVEDKPFSKTMAGRASVHVMKDRGGSVARVPAAGADLFAVMRVAPVAGGDLVEIVVEPPEGSSSLTAEEPADVHARLGRVRAQTADLVREAMVGRAVREVGSMTTLEEWVKDLAARDRSDRWDEAHVDRHYFPDTLVAMDEEKDEDGTSDLAKAGLGVSVSGVGTRRRYRVWLA